MRRLTMSETGALTIDEVVDAPRDDAPVVALGTKERILAYIALTKPRIIELLLITTVPSMIVAAKGIPSFALMFWTVVGGAISAGGANAMNCYIDRDIDELMPRTKRRPLPMHRVSPRGALIFGIALGTIAFFLMWATVNLLSASLSLGALALLCDRLHEDPQADHASEHRDRWCGRSGTGPRRLGCGYRSGRATRARIVRDHLLLDPATLLGAGDAVREGLRGGRGPDDAGGLWAPGDRQAHPVVLVPPPGSLPRVLLGGEGGPCLPRRRTRSSTGSSSGMRCAFTANPNRGLPGGCSSIRSTTWHCCSSPLRSTSWWSSANATAQNLHVSRTASRQHFPTLALCGSSPPTSPRSLHR